MKNKLIKLLGAVALFTALNIQAATYSLLLTNNATNLLATAAWNISSVQVISGSGATNNVNLYDNNIVGITYTNVAYTNFASVKTNFVSTFTNSLGTIQTNTYPGIWTYETPVAAGTNTLPVILGLSLAPSTSQTTTANIITTKGLVATTVYTTNATIVITYSTSP